MKKQVFIFLILLFPVTAAFAQQPLPAITVKNINNKIVVSWINDYTKPVVTLNIQRSYDSLKNYTTIGEVLSPQSRENGYADVNFPYNKMYYRVFIAFEGGSYVISQPVRPVKEQADTLNAITEKFPWLAEPGGTIPSTAIIPGVTGVPPGTISGIPVPVKPAVPLLSTTVFAARDNNVVIHLPDFATKKYSIKFYDENDKQLFELTRLREEYLILEKVNFVHPGWFRFELFENGELKEVNKFQILRDVKKL